MIIQGKKYVKSLNKFLDERINEFRVGIKINDEDIIKKIGFENVEKGRVILPPIKGRFTKLNIEGKEIVRKDLPKKPICYSIYTTRREFRGRNQTEEVTGYIDVCRNVYQKELILGPSLELVIESNGKDLFMMIDGTFVTSDDLTHAILGVNILLELVGYCEIYQKDLSLYRKPQKTIKLNWIILNRDGANWGDRREELKHYIENTKKGKQKVIWDRIDTITKFKPDFEAIGANGLAGYYIFGFKEKNLFVFENVKIGNATYIIKGDWEAISKMSKSTIVKNNLHELRLIHRTDWKNRIEGILA
ncbi:hypothetical protein [Bacillus pumilus]|uniref:hypothetical protein n=1 Tax=Bacillus pumilus TaxID=1408 RepID=UPI001F3754B7|nr:hypothetical protein [Bacillus pumilus]